MIRIIAFLAVLAAAAFGLSWLLEHPGQVSVVWLGKRIETSVFVALGCALLACILFTLLWNLISLVLRLPSLMSWTRRARRRARSHDALTRGMIAVGAGDVRAARRAARDVHRVSPNEPLSLLLRAQVAQMEGNRARAEETFSAMARKNETHLLGLRGLYVEASRKGDAEAAFHFASEAHRAAPLPWAGEAIVAHHAQRSEWAQALEAVERNARAHAVDPKRADRERAVIETALAQDKEFIDPEGALRTARDAVKHASDLVPAVTLAARLLSRRGDFRAASKMIERAWEHGPHPDLGEAYLSVRPGDSASDRFARATALARRMPDHPESRLLVARAALAMRDFARAREAMAPLVAEGAKPTARMCLTMADIEETEHGDTGALREWLARASRAPRDPTWVADGATADRWAPVSPISGKIDAFRWETPREEQIAPPRAPLMAPVAASEPEPEAIPEPAPQSQLPAVIPQPPAQGNGAAANEPAPKSAADESAKPAEEPKALPRPGSAASERKPEVVTLPMSPPDDPGPRPSGAPYSGGFHS